MNCTQTQDKVKLCCSEQSQNVVFYLFALKLKACIQSFQTAETYTAFFQTDFTTKTGKQDVSLLINSDLDSKTLFIQSI